MISRTTSSTQPGAATFGAELAKYTDPMFLPSRSTIPLSTSQVMMFCRWLYISNPHFRQAIIRMIAHGVTRLKFNDSTGSPEERSKFQRKYKEDIKGYKATRLLGQDYVVYGSAFARINYPFNRQLIDRRGGSIRTYSLSGFKEGSVTFNLTTLTYTVPDPRRTDLPEGSRPKISLPFRDVARRDAAGIQIVRLDPKYVKLRFSSWANERQVQYSFEPEFKARINNGDLYEINRTPIEVLRAVRDRQDFLFAPKQVFCMINETISGFINNGFGLPETVTAFPQLYRMALYDRLDESISNEMMVPYRFFSPTTVPEGITLNGAEFRSLLKRAVDEQRADRTKISVFPVPVQYQEVGGNGKALVPKDLKDYETTQLMHALGIPAELITGSLRMDAIPYAIRLFESSHADLFEDLSSFTKWAVAGITKFLYGEAYDATMEPSSVIDDANRRIILRDLYSAQEIPRRLVGDSLQLEDMMGLKKERAEEDLKIQETLATLEEEAKRRMELGSIEALMNQGPAPGGGPATTPVDTMDEAQAMASEWLAMPIGQRQQAMQAAAAQNRQVYAMAKDIMDQMRSQGASQGVQQVYQQAQQTVQGP